MLKRFGLFLLTNFLVIVTVSVILNFVLPLFGVKLSGTMGMALFCGVFGMTGAFISLWISKWMAKRAYNLQIIDGNTRDPGLRSIHDMIVRLARQAQLPKPPEVAIYESPDPNAFATGPSKNNSLVAFSTGLLRSMNQQEIEAVAAHEVSHIANGDMVTMTLLTGIANTFVMFFSRIVASVIDNFLRGDEGEGGLGFLAYFAVVFVLDTVFMLLASIPLAAFSRWREYRADAGAAKLTSPHAMAAALQRLKEFTEVETPKDSFVTAKISSGRRLSLWSSHPPLDARIARLKQGRSAGF
ncbi:MAG: protease HtpX [Leptospirales bacterium]|jgi:heat shock protein HtpX